MVKIDMSSSALFVAVTAVAKCLSRSCLRCLTSLVRDGSPSLKRSRSRTKTYGSGCPRSCVYVCVLVPMLDKCTRRLLSMKSEVLQKCSVLTVAITTSLFQWSLCYALSSTMLTLLSCDIVSNHAHRECCVGMDGSH